MSKSYSTLDLFGFMFKASLMINFCIVDIIRSSLECLLDLIHIVLERHRHAEVYTPGGYKQLGRKCYLVKS